MLKDRLKKQQPIVYRALENACRRDSVSNAYLFWGPYGTMKNEAALLLAQSIFCSETDGLACETCNTCRRVKEGLYTDLIVLDGAKKAISKEMVDAIQEQFSKTSLEGTEGTRVYIIQNAETASISARQRRHGHPDHRQHQPSAADDHLKVHCPAVSADERGSLL